MKTNVDFGRVTLRLITCLYFFNFFEILKNKKNKMFRVFIHFEKAFDKVWRDGLWYKLLLINMNGNMYNIIVNMYCGTNSCTFYNDCKSEFFPCNNGVRQVENFFPFFLPCSLMTLNHT